jgi:serine/threonine-protein kinase
LQACEAIAEAHSVGIVHRDLKPSNLFIADTLGERRMVKVLDFGVSKWLGPTPETEALLSTGAYGFVGTPAYMSPEQLTRPDSVDERTDVWALGVVLHRCLSGDLPFEVDSVPRLCAAILTDEPRPLRPLGVPEGLSAVVLRCLRKAPKERFQNILEFAHALAPFAPPAGRQSLELIERLSHRPAPEIEVQRTPVPAPAVTPGNQSTTAGFSQETRVSGAPSPSRFRFPALGRRRLSVLLAGAALAAVGVAVSMTRNADDQPPVDRPLLTEPNSTEPVTLSAPTTLSPEAPPGASNAGKPMASASTTSIVPPAPQRAKGTGTRRAAVTGAPAASAAPIPSSSTAAPAPSAHSPVPSPEPSARSSDDFDRNIYRR